MWLWLGVALPQLLPRRKMRDNPRPYSINGLTVLLWSFYASFRR